MTLLVLALIALGLFGLAYVTKRRFGLLGLGLTAGLVLSREISKDTAGILEVSDFPVEPLTPIAAATVLLILSPALVMLFAGPKYYQKRAALIGSAMFGVFGIVILLPALVGVVPTTDPSVVPTLSFIAMNSPWIIAAGVIAAVFDIMQTHSKKGLGKKDKH